MSDPLSNHLLFSLGALTFLITYSWFKYAEIEIFRADIKSNTILDGSRFSLFVFFIAELIICSGGVMGLGNLFILLYDLTPEITLLLTIDPALECPLANIPINKPNLDSI